MKPLAIAFLALVSVTAQAAINLNIDNPDQVVNLPLVGSVDVDFTGSVVCSADWKPTGSSGLAHPFLINSSTGLSSVSFDAGFLNYLFTANFGDDYSGKLFTFSVPSSTTPGYYGYQFSSSNASTYGVQGVNTGGGNYYDDESYSITVNAVPEPATISILGLGVLALVRRKK